MGGRKGLRCPRHPGNSSWTPARRGRQGRTLGPLPGDRGLTHLRPAVRPLLEAEPDEPRVRHPHQDVVHAVDVHGRHAPPLHVLHHALRRQRPVQAAVPVCGETVPQHTPPTAASGARAAGRPPERCGATTRVTSKGRSSASQRRALSRRDKSTQRARCPLESAPLTTSLRRAVPGLGQARRSPPPGTLCARPARVARPPRKRALCAGPRV